jgi:serine/threonine protein phosphatase PrpC
MEDSHVAHDVVPNTDNKLSYYAVFDGHGGRESADICAEELLAEILSRPSFPQDIPAALNESFLNVDNRILEKAKALSWNNGSTGAVALVHEGTIFVGDVGDSEIVVGKRQGDKIVAECLTQKHKPNDEHERARIERNGGQVIFGRVLGSLAVARYKHQRTRSRAHAHAQCRFVAVCFS